MDDREAEGRGLSGPRLRAGHQVAAGEADRDRVALDGRRLGVLAPRDVGHQRGPEVDVGERRDRVGDVVASRLDGDVLVGVEVDARVLLGLEEGVDLGLGAGVGLEGVVLAVIFFFFFFWKGERQSEKKKGQGFLFRGKKRGARAFGRCRRRSGNAIDRWVDFLFLPLREKRVERRGSSPSWLQAQVMNAL